MKDALKIFLFLLKGTGFEPIANRLESALMDGRITVDEGKDLVDAAVPIAEQFLAAEKPELELFKDLADAAAKYYDAKEAQKEAAAAKAKADAAAAAKNPTVSRPQVKFDLTTGIATQKGFNSIGEWFEVGSKVPSVPPPDAAAPTAATPAPELAGKPS